MTLLFSARGVRDLRALARRRCALVFDLDGTLAPLVAQRTDAQVPAATAARLQQLCRSWPTAVVTGRSASDAAARLGFEPGCLIGNHGAERWGASATDNSRALHSALAPVRERLRLAAGDLQACGIEVEDKGLSLALHYRDSTDPATALATARELLATGADALRIAHGHHVVNVTPLNAPDKGDALKAVLAEWDLDCALVVGDDSNDEPAFLKAPPGSVTVRIGPLETRTSARFRLDFQTDVDQLLDQMLRLRAAAGSIFENHRAAAVAGKGKQRHLEASRTK